MFKRLLLLLLPFITPLSNAYLTHCPFFNPLTITSPKNSTSTIDYNCDDTYYLLSDKSFIQKTIDLAQKPEPIEGRRLQSHSYRTRAASPPERLRSSFINHGSYRSLQNISLFTDCYPGIKTQNINNLQIGVMIGHTLFHKRFKQDVTRTLKWIELQVKRANVIYISQFNLKIMIKHVVFPNSQDTWTNFNCKDNSRIAYARLMSEIRYRSPSPQAIWHLFDDCDDGTYKNPIGLATIGGICEGFGRATSLTYLRSFTWRTFAHEIGHNVGARHSFENGTTTTGGVMDYGNGMYNGKYMFHKYRHQEICNQLKKSMGVCSKYFSTDPPGVDHTGSKNQCINKNGTLKTTRDMCLSANGMGYCSHGVCLTTQCTEFGTNFCGVRKDNPCRIQCIVNSVCNPMIGWNTKYGKVNVLDDESMCAPSGGADEAERGVKPEVPPPLRGGVCRKGYCVPIQKTTEPTLPPSVAPITSPPVVPTPSPSATTRPKFLNSVDSCPEDVLVSAEYTIKGKGICNLIRRDKRLKSGIFTITLKERGNYNVTIQAPKGESSYELFLYDISDSNEKVVLPVPTGRRTPLYGGTFGYTPSGVHIGSYLSLSEHEGKVIIETKKRVSSKVPNNAKPYAECKSKYKKRMIHGIFKDLSIRFINSNKIYFSIFG